MNGSQSNNNRERARLIVAVGILSALAAVVVWLLLTGRLAPIVSFLIDLFKSKDSLRQYVESWNTWAPIAFISIQIFQVVLAPIPGELTGAVGGFVFGAWHNIVYSTIGLTVGSCVAFLAARHIGKPIVLLMVGKKAFERFQFLTERRGTLLAFILFIIPGFPKDVLCHLLGLSPMGFLTFVLVCGLGRLPGTIMLSFSGSALYHENWVLLGVLSVVCAILIGLVFLYRDRIESWLRNWDAPPKGPEERKPRDCSERASSRCRP